MGHGPTDLVTQLQNDKFSNRKATIMAKNKIEIVKDVSNEWELELILNHNKNILICKFFPYIGRRCISLEK